MTGQRRRSSDIVLPEGMVTVTRTLVGRDGQPLSIRAAAESSGTFEGYACLWDVVDSYGTRFAPATFGRGGLDTDPYALLAMHDPWQPIGTFTAREDDTGLWIAGGWDPTPEGQAGRARAISGSAPELSVGFVPLAVDPDDDDRFVQARLVEVSQITRRMAAVPGAAFATARSSIPGDGEPDDDEPVAAARVAAAILALTERPR